jgi:hypothetical protein
MIATLARLEPRFLKSLLYIIFYFLKLFNKNRKQVWQVWHPLISIGLASKTSMAQPWQLPHFPTYVKQECGFISHCETI